MIAVFAAAGHDIHWVTDQQLNGQPDGLVMDVCNREQRAPVTLDMDFSDNLAHSPARFGRIIVLRLATLLVRWSVWTNLPPATIVTSGVNDITHLLQSAKAPYALFGGHVPASAQVIIVKA